VGGGMSEHILTLIGGFMLGFCIAAKAIPSMTMSACDEIGIASIGDVYYDCKRRP